MLILLDGYPNKENNKKKKQKDKNEQVKVAGFGQRSQQWIFRSPEIYTHNVVVTILYTLYSFRNIYHSGKFIQE